MLPTKLDRYNQKPHVVAHFCRLGLEDRRLRFGAPISDEAMQKYVDDYWTHPGAWFGIYDGSKLIACVHVAVVNGEAELGLSVEPDYRGQKLGRKLFERAVVFIKSKAIKHVYMHCLSENAVVRHLAKAYGMTMVTSHGETDARATIDFPFTPMDTINEAVAQQLALYDNGIRAFAKYWVNNIERVWETLPMHKLKDRNG